MPHPEILSIGRALPPHYYPSEVLSAALWSEWNGPPEERARFEEHLADCGYCTLHVEQMRTTVRVVGSLKQPAAPPDLQAQVVDLFRKWKQGRS